MQYDTDMSRRPCEKGGTCVGVLKESRYGLAVRCKKCGSLFGYVRQEDKPKRRKV